MDGTIQKRGQHLIAETLCPETTGILSSLFPPVADGMYSLLLALFFRSKHPSQKQRPVKRGGRGNVYCYVLTRGALSVIGFLLHIAM